jgi:uncharacterized protein YciI
VLPGQTEPEVRQEGGIEVKYVLFYGGAMAAGHHEQPQPEGETAAARMQRIMRVFPDHRKRLDQFHAAGTLLMVGAFANPLADGSMGVFTTREAAEEFVREDPFMLAGVMRSWRIIEWNESLVPDA